jgi:hypothetical protein
MSSRELLTKIAKEMKKNPSDFEKFADILASEFLDEAESLKDVTEEQWRQMRIPIGIVNKIRATFKEVPKPDKLEF